MRALLRSVASFLTTSPARIDSLRLAVGRSEARIIRQARVERLSDAEFQVFSQWGEDGIIQYLLGKVPIENRTFVEFGVQDYAESNTRFLLCNDNWSGVIIDAAGDHQRFLERRGLDWRHEIEAVKAFITRENIDELIGDAGLRGDIGLLSVDIDGNDYWVLEAIAQVSPRILAVEYNSHFGPDHAVSIPYQPDFDRRRSAWPHLYFGASLLALCHLAERKGYAFVGSNSAGNNAFFVRRDVLGSLPQVDPRQGWVPAKYRESAQQRGRIAAPGSHRERLRAVAHLPVVEVTTGRTVPLGEVMGLSPSRAAP